MEYKIKKAKIKLMSLDVAMEEIIYPENASPITNDVVKKSDQLIHEDLRRAFNSLRPHLIMICEQSEADDINALLIMDTEFENIPEELLEKYAIIGMQVGGDVDNPGAVIHGSKSTMLGNIDLITPLTKYSSQYKYADELAEAIASCVNEVEAYLFEGKCAIKQMELPFDEEETQQRYDEESVLLE